ncbi:MAG TPA: beta-galactosidase [Candidatus Hydrogenedentes bacterium]|nr:beta-galactosidase [Candidatus Hydrogenedentota bacterium]
MHLHLILCLFCLLVTIVEPVADSELLDFGVETLPEWVIPHDADLRRVPHEGGHAREARFHVVDWPNVFFQAPPEGWDWSAFSGVAVALYNPTDTAVSVSMRVDNAGADGVNHCNNAWGEAPARDRFVLRCYFNTGDAEVFWGMRGVPERGPLGSGPKLDTTKITAFQVFLPRPQQEHTLVFERAWLFGPGGDRDARVPMPFIDRFGQYAHADWPGKLHEESDFIERRAAEETALAAAPRLPGRDRLGGWADGPRREATGWFRTEKVDGKWWLVTPEGALFFSLGMDCVGTGEQTFVEGRDGWFAWLPGEDEPDFRAFLGQVEGAHSGADRIGGKGRAFSFYRANLLRKYGENWPEAWRETTYRRLESWGFNTVGNWSQHDTLDNSPMPFVAATGIGGVRPIEGARGYWAKMKDVYAPEFEEQADRAFAWVGKKYASNPLCIGYFCDNELAWEGFARGTLDSPLDQPARVAFVAQLRERYPEIDELNAAWGTDATDWDALRTPTRPNAAAKADLDEYLYRFALRYFDIVRAACRRHAPHQLYLGCRFAGLTPPPVARACAEVADVMSYNLYYQEIPREKFLEYDKPILIGEFHFGALDRGMFHAGLVAKEDQAARAAAYARYVRSVAAHPNFVGCHWFQYVDEPTTGRWFDGENYNIGFVTVADAPYPELVEAARRAHDGLFGHVRGSMESEH